MSQPIKKTEIDVNEDIRRIMIRNGIKDKAVQVEYNGSTWTLLLRKKLVKPVGGAWNSLVYIDAYHMENEKHFGTVDRCNALRQCIGTSILFVSYVLQLILWDPRTWTTESKLNSQLAA